MLSVVNKRRSKMVKKKEIEQNWKKIDSQFKRSRKILRRGKA